MRIPSKVSVSGTNSRVASVPAEAGNRHLTVAVATIDPMSALRSRTALLVMANGNDALHYTAAKT